MIKLFALLGRMVLFLAACAWIAAVSLFVVGAWLVSWPIMRMNPRSQRVQALIMGAVALSTLLRVFTPEEIVDELFPPEDDENGAEN